MRNFVFYDDGALVADALRLAPMGDYLPTGRTESLAQRKNVAQ